MTEALRRGRRFLVVDDNATARMVLKAVLARFGDVDIAEDGATALELYRDRDGKRPYDLALIDIMMPGMDGMALVRELRAMDESAGTDPVRFAMTTGLDERRYVHAALKEGAAGYLIKPVSPSRVVNLLQRLDLAG